jgi:hypothetical protein
LRAGLLPDLRYQLPLFFLTRAVERAMDAEGGNSAGSEQEQRREHRH